MMPARSTTATRPVRKWIAAAVFVVLFAVVPPVIVAASAGLDPESWVCGVEVESTLADTLGGKLEFLLVGGVEGKFPADRFVITIDHGYTAGVEPEVAQTGDPRIAPGRTFSIVGALMDRSTYFGEQYLFFGYPQLYVSQVKSGFLWPSQWERLTSLYVSPFTSLGSVYLVWAYPFTEEYTRSAWLLVIARFVLVCAAVAVALVVRKRVSRWGRWLIVVVGLYALLMIALGAVDL